MSNEWDAESDYSFTKIIVAVILLTFIFVAVLDARADCNAAVTQLNSATQAVNVECVSVPTTTTTTTTTTTVSTLPPIASAIVVWHQSGEDKVPRGDRWGAKTNLLWQGSKIMLSGAANETVSFATVIEAADTDVAGLTTSLTSLTNGAGNSISTVAKTGDELFNYVGRNIEQFYVRYQEIKGLSQMSYDGCIYDERHCPAKLRVPTYDENGRATDKRWVIRPDHNKFYPEIAVPLELHSPFTVKAKESQTIWTDIYIPKGTAPGVYTGKLYVRKSGVQVKAPTVELTVLPFALPDTDAAQFTSWIGAPDIAERFVGKRWPETQAEQDTTYKILDKYFQIAKRHRVHLFDDDWGVWAWNQNRPRPSWDKRLDGTLYTAVNGYAGPYEAKPHGLYVIGSYGSWPSALKTNCTAMQAWARDWVNWFKSNSPQTFHWLYLIDESNNYPLIQGWAQCVDGAPAPGNELTTFASMRWTDAKNNVPALDFVGNGFTFGYKAEWEAAQAWYKSRNRKLMLYNGKRPAQPSWAQEEEGVGPRAIPWIQVRKAVDWWFLWDSAYYYNYQGGTGNTDVFNSAFIFGGKGTSDPVKGETGWNYTNGDGILLYPGTDKVFPASNYGRFGVFASLRLKYLRRGIQDAAYIALAKAKDPIATQAIVDRMVPKVLWEITPGDAEQSWAQSDISWSTNPDVWEQARRDLIGIITRP